jgi:gliding motility-associated lipoprotein GldH
MADLSFILRHNNEYSFSNIFLITEFSANGNLIDKDTLEFKLANYRGEWLGNKKISIIEHELPYKRGLIFDSSEYKLNIRTSMRSRNKATEIERLDGIVNFGLLID